MSAPTQTHNSSERKLSADEQELLMLFRKLDDLDQNALITQARTWLNLSKRRS